jgi:hypothetical protein
MSSNSDVLDAIAKYFLCLAREPSYWFTLNSSWDDDDDGNGNANTNQDECHLSHRLGMNQNEYRALLVAAGLARFHPGGGGNKFHICRETWCNNLRGHPRFVSTTEIIPYPLFELSTCRLSVIHGYRQPVSVHAIRIGRKIMDVPPTSLSSQKRANIPPPEMSNDFDCPSKPCVNLRNAMLYSRISWLGDYGDRMGVPNDGSRRLLAKIFENITRFLCANATNCRRFHLR